MTQAEPIRGLQPPGYCDWSKDDRSQDEEGKKPMGCRTAANIYNLLRSKASREEHATHSLGWPEPHWSISQQTWHV